MITEIAQIEIKFGSAPMFEAAVAEALPLFATAKGFQGLELQRGVERPDHYVLLIRWATIENHTTDFRNSMAFQRWRELVGPHFAGPAEVEHITRVLA